MNRITIELEHCYGIKKLNATLDFSKKSACAIYAQNGVMKTSLAETFRDVSKGVQPVDRIFPTRQSICKIFDEVGTELPKESVLVVKSYDQEFRHTDKTTTLLVDAELKKEHDQLYAEVEEAKDNLLKAIKKQSGSKKPLEKEISFAITRRENDFWRALTRIKQELEDLEDTPFADVEYDTIFDDRVLGVIEQQDVKTAIRDYMERYNQLLAASTYFKKGTFDYFNAGKIAKALADHGFFKADHSVNLIGSEKLEIKSQKELEDVVAREKEAILKDKELRKSFDKVAKNLEKNETIRDFQQYMLDHEDLLSQLSDVNTFKENVFKSYLKVHYDLYLDLMAKYESTLARDKQIREEAAKQKTQWSEVIRIFNDRFYVPFRFDIKNKIEVMLGNQPIDLGFTYHDGNDDVQVDEQSLMRCLSQGEKKAFYILNVLFEIRTRKVANQETLLIIDDIADSFDYQNKYAIIHYLKEVSEDPLFKQIIMTHNFDFFRTLESRFVDYNQCFIANKDESGVTLRRASGIKNVFVNDWKKKFYKDSAKKLASICFLRNLVEFTYGNTDPRFTKLTSLVHWKSDSAAITVADLDTIYNDICNENGASTDPTLPVMDLLSSTAQTLLSSTSKVALEDKVVLSIAIRIEAEKFMVAKIANPAFVSSITSFQTQALLAEMRRLYPHEAQSLEVLDLVALMTAENIHLNSFMYEPIMDMSDDRLKDLYKKVQALA